MFKTLDFDAATQEFAQFEVWFPKSWNLGTVTFQPVWSHAATATNFGVVRQSGDLKHQPRLRRGVVVTSQKYDGRSCVFDHRRGCKASLKSP